MKRFNILALLTFSVGTALAQQVSPSQPVKERDLPNYLAPWEVPLIRPYTESRAGASRGITTPPDFTPRTMAEWEEVQSVVIAWTSYPGILKQIVRAAKMECEVIIACDDAASVTAFLADANNGGPITDLTNITFLEAPFNSVWSRDYGAETIYKNEVDSLFLLDWIYNRPRPEDDALSDEVGAAKNIAVYSTTQAPNDLVHTGGNFMADGFGTAFSSELVLDENGPDGQFNQTVKTQAQVEALMETWMGIPQGRYILMNTLPNDVIHHIDMHMKLIDEETLLVGQFPTGVSDGPQLEQNLDAINANYNSVFGTPYRMVRIPMPPSTGGAFPPNASYRTYANNLFLNRTVIVPLYRTEYDTTALRILHEELPGYNIVGIDCDNAAENIISASGAIHCITKGIGVADPLLIQHQRLDDTYETVIPYTVDAYIRHRTDIASAEVYWTTDTTAGYTALPMTALPDNHWTAGIPAQAVGSEVFYYIHATANSGKQQVRPIVAPEGWWKFRVLDINAGTTDGPAPVIAEVYPNPTSTVLVVTVADAGDARVSITLQDATGREVLHVLNGRVPADRRVFTDLTGLASGAYMLVVQSPSGRSTARVVRR
ncbi:MAG: agmatine deiminase family protein [Flavobacteriales bacterium]